MPRRKALTGLLVAFGLAAAALGGAAFAYPAAAAIACPTCFGFERIGSGVYVQGVRSPGAQASAHVVDEGRAKVRAFYRQLESHPEILLCTTDACYKRVGGGASRGMALLDRALVLSPRGLNPTIAAHELAHVELHARLGLVKTMRRTIPQWFDEGLAVYVSDDPRYIAAAGATDRCLVAESSEALPTTRQAWVENAASRDLYAKAACRVSRWLARKGGAPAAIELIRRVADGQSFDAAYR